jgi:hypothetical protein
VLERPGLFCYSLLIKRFTLHIIYNPERIYAWNRIK